jgi:zinc ribbon protein
MQCEGCGAELVDGARTCSACGRQVGMGQRATGESVKVVKETGAAAEKVGKSLWGGVKSLESKAKKEFKRSDDEKK